MTDNVNSPKHYTYGKFEVIDVLQEFFPDDPLVWQVGKYIARYKHKGKPLEDLKKARWYLERRIKQLERAQRVQNMEKFIHEKEPKAVKYGSYTLTVHPDGSGTWSNEAKK